MNSSLLLSVALLGGIVSSVSFFLPWVKAQFIPKTLPLAGALLGFINPELKNLVEQLGAYSSISGYQALFTVNGIAQDFRLLVLLPTVLGVIAIVGGGLGIVWPDGVRPISIVLAALGAVLLAFLVFNIPKLGHLGHDDTWMVTMAVSLLGFTPTLGFWGSLCGVLLVCLGSALALLLGETGRSRQPRGQRW